MISARWSLFLSLLPQVLVLGPMLVTAGVSPQYHRWEAVLGKGCKQLVVPLREAVRAGGPGRPAAWLPWELSASLTFPVRLRHHSPRLDSPPCEQPLPLPSCPLPSIISTLLQRQSLLQGLGVISKKHFY